MIKKSKTVIIGIDGVPYGLMKDLSDRGVMPNFKSLREKGVFRKMASSVPAISSVSWSSIITGRNPGEHGIFGFTQLLPKTYTISFPNFNNLRSLPFWLKKNGKKYVILNVPSTYPAKKLNGVHIAGFVALDLEKAVYPQKYLKKLKEINYQVDVDSAIAHKSTTLFLEKLFENLNTRLKAYRYFWQKESWDVFMLVFTGTDRLGHFLWRAFENKKHKYHSDFLRFFKKIDEAIGEINQRLEESDSLFLLSDHGMESIKTNVNLNYFLQKQGFLDLGSTGRGHNRITSKTLAFVLDPDRIYLNKKLKYPRGRIEKKDEKKVIEDLIESLENLKYKGQKVIKKMYKKEEIYQGKHLDLAPDLVLLENPGFRLKGALRKTSLFENDVFEGKHTQPDAFLLAKTKKIAKIKISQKPKLEDFLTYYERMSK